MGKDQPQVAMTLNILGRWKSFRGHLDDVEKYFDRTAAINRSVYGDRHYLVGIAMLNLGKVYLEKNSMSAPKRSIAKRSHGSPKSCPPGMPTPRSPRANWGM